MANIHIYTQRLKFYYSVEYDYNNVIAIIVATFLQIL